MSSVDHSVWGASGYVGGAYNKGGGEGELDGWFGEGTRVRGAGRVDFRVDFWAAEAR